MLIPVPRQYRKSRGRSKPFTPPGLAITQVQRHATIAEQVKIFFAAPGGVTWDGATTPLQFKVFTGDGFFDSPLDVLASGSDWIEVEFNAEVAIGAAWQLNGPAAGITPAVAWPQAGVVTA